MKTTSLHGWSRTTKSKSTVLDAHANFSGKLPAIPRGAGLSYGDAALNRNGYVLVGRQSHLQIDEKNNQVEVSADVKLAELLNYLRQYKKSLQILPGSSRVTVGGCIAANIHGKNHHKDGSFSQIVQGIFLVTDSNKKEVYCDNETNKDLFEATLGGMGLTGYISRACLTLSPLPTCASLNFQEFHNLEELFKDIEALRTSNLNVLALINWSAGLSGKGKIIRYSLKFDENRKRQKNIKSRNFLPLQIKLINKFTIRLYNKMQFRFNSKQKNVKPNSVIFMADKNRNANLWFGKKGFIEYQFSIPLESVDVAIRIMRDFYSSFTIFLSGVKLLSNKSIGMLNFYQTGYTITLTTIPSENLYRKLEEYDLLLSENGGKVYLAKDSRMKASNFSRMYPNLSLFKDLRSKLNLQYFESDLSRRLSI